MKDEWVKHCIEVAGRKADLWSGCRKIVRNVTLHFGDLERDLLMPHAGYTQYKMRQLERHYLHPESHEAAVTLWDKRREQQRYGSVGFTTYNHFIKDKSIDAKRSKRASVMGPCLQSVVITLTHKDRYAVDIFYRTTELLKKFPADLVFIRDRLLTSFCFDDLALDTLTCHFANLTWHPMYFVTIIPHLPDPTQTLDFIKRRDKHLFDWTVKWSGRYLCPEHHRGIAKHAQSQRVKLDASKRISKPQLKTLQTYIRANHPGYRNDYDEEVSDVL